MKREETANKAQCARTAFLKRRSLPFALIFAGVCACVTPDLFAQAGAPGAIFDFGAGARPLAMGGAYSAVVKEASSLYYNPAGLSMLSSRNVSLMHATLFEGMSYDYIGYAQSYRGFPGGWGAQVLRFSAGAAEGRDENNLPTSAFTYTETAMAVGTGVHGIFMPSLSLGASVKLLNRALAADSNRLIGFDMGAQYGPLMSEKLSLALVIRNFGSFAMGDTADKLPFGFKLGAAYLLSPNISVCADLSGNGEIQFGTEYGIGIGAIRLGYDRDSFSFGGGLKFMKSYQLDYAMYKHPELGLSNRISLSYFFGGVAAPPKVRVYASEYIKKAENGINARDYSSAYTSVDMSIGMDPAVRNGVWGEKFRRLDAVVTGLKLKELPGRQKLLKENTPQAVEAGRSINEYLDGNNDKSSLLAHSAMGYQPGNAFFSDFLTVMSGLTRTEIKKDEILPRNTLAKEKLRKAEAFFRMANYDKAAKECEQVLMIEEDNELAWTRLGSSYYALGDLQRAKQAFLKVLAINPNNTSVRDFVLLQGWTK